MDASFLYCFANPFPISKIIASVVIKNWFSSLWDSFDASV